MKTIGLIGGMSWESTRTYYKINNETIYKKLGGLHLAKIIWISVDFIVICMNTMHKVVDPIRSAITIPILNIAEVTTDALNKERIESVALLGTKYTVDSRFYQSKLIEAGINVIVPGIEDIELANNVIYEELCLGVIKDESK